MEKIAYTSEQIRKYIEDYGRLIRFIFDHIDRHDKNYWKSLEQCLKDCKKIPKECRPGDYEEKIKDINDILNYYKKDRKPQNC